MGSKNSVWYDQVDKSHSFKTVNGKSDIDWHLNNLSIISFNYAQPKYIQ